MNECEGPAFYDPADLDDLEIMPYQDATIWEFIERIALLKHDGECSRHEIEEECDCADTHVTENDEAVVTLGALILEARKIIWEDEI